METIGPKSALATCSESPMMSALLQVGSSERMLRRNFRIWDLLLVSRPHRAHLPT